MAETNTLDLTELNDDEEPTVQAEITDAPVEETEESEDVEEEPKEVEEEPKEVEEEPEESVEVEEPDETEGPEEPVEPEETEGPEEPVPSVQEVVSNVKEILTSDPVEESVSELSFTDKFNELTRIVQALGFRDPWNSRLSALKESTDSDTDKLRELIDVLKDWRFKPEYRNKLVTISADSDSSVEDRFLQVVDIVERIGLREPFRSQLISLK